MSRRRRRLTKHPPKALSLSATDADWAVVKEKAERRRLSISRYAVALVLGGGWDARDGPALVLSGDEQREMFEAVRAFRALMGDGAQAPTLIADMQARVALLFDAWAIAMVRDGRRDALRALLAERVVERIVVRSHHPALAEHEPFERDRLRRRQRDVEPRAVLVLAVSHPPQPNVGIGDVPREHLLEALRVDLAAKPERRRPVSVPGARAAVLELHRHVVPVAHEVAHPGLGGAEYGDGGDHRAGLRVRGPHVRRCHPRPPRPQRLQAQVERRIDAKEESSIDPTRSLNGIIEPPRRFAPTGDRLDRTR